MLSEPKKKGKKTLNKPTEQPLRDGSIFTPDLKTNMLSYVCLRMSGDVTLDKAENYT